MNTLYIWHEINQTAVKIKCIIKLLKIISLNSNYNHPPGENNVDFVDFFLLMILDWYERKTSRK